MLRRLTVFAVLLAYAGIVWAIQPPQEFVEQTAGQTIARFKAQRERIESNPHQIYELVEDILLPHFDFPKMAKWVLGKHWRRATPEQRKRFTEEFRTMLVRTYASSLMKYIDNEITYPPSPWSPTDRDVIVRSEIERGGGLPIAVHYRLHMKNDAWKIYDVTIDDISLVVNYRSSFSTEIRKSGMNQLVDKLAARNKQIENE